MDVEGPGNPRAGGNAALAATFPSNAGPGGPEQLSATTNYTIPGILHFIKHEWSRFEKEKSMWEVERAELQVCMNVAPPSSSVIIIGEFPP